MLEITSGICRVTFAHDVAFSIDLAKAAERVQDFARVDLKRHRRATSQFRYEPAPLRIVQQGEALRVAGYETRSAIESILYDFGGVSVTYSIPLAGPIDRLLDLSYALYENPLLLDDSRKGIRRLMEALGDAATLPGFSDVVEDYVIFQVSSFNCSSPLAAFVERESPLFAQILRAEKIPLSADEIRDSVAHRISFGAADMAVVDWNAAIVIDSEPEDVVAVLEFANVELMEMRYLDNRLDEELGLAYEALARESKTRFSLGASRRAMRQIGQWQVDSAILFEGVNNALKLVGDQYLARLYRVAAERFHLAQWDTTIIRKLETLNSIYTKLSDLIASRRMEVLEWIVIILIAVSIVLPFVTGLPH